MELREFVSETLKELIDGITSAQEYAAQKGASINPQGMTHVGELGLVVVENTNQRQYPMLQTLEFDVAITVMEGTDAKAGIGVFAGAIGVGTQARMQDSNMTVSRVRFSVPVLFPQQRK